MDEIVGGLDYLDGPADIHSVENSFDEDAVSLHVYAKPYNLCYIYYLEKKKIRRRSLSYYSKFGEIC